MTPHEELFIYYLKGRLELSDQKFQNNFIGNWEEEDDSIYPFRSDAQRSETYCRYPSKVSGQNIKAMVPGRHLAYNIWEEGAV